MDVIFQVFVWSLTCLATGTFPTRDWRGAEFTDSERAQQSGFRICGPYVWAWLMVAADLDYLSNYLRLPHFNASSNLCFLCLANRSTVPFNDYAENALWTTTTRTWQQWLDLDHSTVHRLFRAYRTLGLTWFNCILDIMHVCDLGVACHIL
eukprot:7541725-Alexandrium_andersonii.AAC.1